LFVATKGGGVHQLVPLPLIVSSTIAMLMNASIHSFIRQLQLCGNNQVLSTKIISNNFSNKNAMESHVLLLLLTFKRPLMLGTIHTMYK